MKTRRILLLLLSLAMLLGLLCGCGGQSAQAQPSPAAPEETVTATVATAAETTVPETTPPEPPITGEEFLSKLNARLSELEIPLEASVYTGEDVQTPKTSPYCIFRNTATGQEYKWNSGLSLNMELRLRDSAVKDIYFNCKDSADAKLIEWFPQITAAAAAICDSSITEEEALSFYDQEPTEVYDWGTIFEHISEANNTAHSISHSQYDGVTQTGYSIYFTLTPLELDSSVNFYADLDLLEEPAVGENGAFTFTIDDMVPLINAYLADCNGYLSISYDTGDMSRSYHPINYGSLTMSMDSGVLIALHLSDFPNVRILDLSYASNYVDGLEQSWLKEQPELFFHIHEALSMLCDSGMTEEEAVQLHSHALGLEPTKLSADSPMADRTLYVYSPRDTIHILLEYPNGVNDYMVLSKATFDEFFGGDLNKMFG